MTTDNGSSSATGRPSGVVADLAVELPVVPHTMPVPEADRMFRRRPALRGVAVQRRAGEDPVLLTRSRLSSELSGAYGYGRALYERRTLHDIVPPQSLVVPDDLSLTSAAQAALERDVHDRYEDVVVRWRDGTVGLLPVTALFERLTGIFRSLALHDALTGLPNRMHLEQVAERRADDGAGAALLYVDLDGFKTVNDIQGHRTGDRLLREFAARLRDCVRPGDVVARLGGDEFALLLPGVSDAEAELVAGRVVQAAAEPFFLGNSTVRIGASVGIAELGGSGSPGVQQVDDLIKDADAAMYRAKADGRGRVVRLDDAARAAHVGRATLTARLAHAVETGGIELHYQPKIDLRTGTTVGFEALARWTDEVLGGVPPSAFIPVAETTGLMVMLGRQLLLSACITARSWLDDGRPWSVAVNVSPAQLERTDVVEDLCWALAESQLPAERLQLEITELSAITDVPATRRTLYDVRALGVRTSLDDFGTGYSSLSLLRELPLDELKIDRSFVDRIDVDRADVRLVSLTIAAAHEYGLVAVAEGVERVEQLEVLRGLGCDVAQGFLLGRPAPQARPAQLAGVTEPVVSPQQRSSAESAPLPRPQRLPSPGSARPVTCP